MKNKKKIISTLIIILLILLLAGSTYAFWIWESDRNTDTNVAFTTQGKDFSCSADGGGNITSNDVLLQPTTCTDSSHAIIREIHTSLTNNTSDPLRLDLWLNINSIDTELANSSNFKWAISTSNQGCDAGTVINSGDFNRKQAGDKTYITGQLHSTSENNTYYLYIWLDEEETDTSTAGKSFNMSLGGECSDSNLPNKPYINDSGLIPVKLSAKGDTVTAISEDDPSWYDYYNKKWANAVLVDSTNRSSYQNLSLGTEVEIPTSEILAYYVWIPRYSYKVWQYTGNSSSGQEHEIDVKFVGKNTKDVATQNGDWFTPPGFTFGDTELSGFWVGKFEASYSTNNNVDINCTTETCANADNLRVLPLKKSLTNNSISSSFFGARSMEQENNSFGLNSSNVTSRMLKNSEWGAIAYLSHSKYGINGKITRNNTNTTGRGDGAANYEFDIVYPQSTTGNVTGIFDMVGGGLDWVMGNERGIVGNSGFSSLPEAKYYDDYGVESTLGSAMDETRNWYETGYSAGWGNRTWIYRGGNQSTASSGIFSYASWDGTKNNTSFHPVLTEK